MKILIHEHVLTVKEEDGKVLDVIRNDSYVISPDEGKVLVDKRTGLVINSAVGVSRRADIDDYEERDAI